MKHVNWDDIAWDMAGTDGVAPVAQYQCRLAYAGTGDHCGSADIDW
jgi:hypothetical protein